MKLFIFAIFSLLIFLTVKVYAAEKFVSGEVLIKFNKEVSRSMVSEVVAAYDMEIESSLKSTGIFKLVFPDDNSVMDKVKELSKDPRVKFAEPNYLLHISRAPNDPDFSLQWGLQNLGQAVNESTAGIANVDIGAVMGWNTQIGSNDVTIAIIDTGVNYNHPDLLAKIWKNISEMNCTDGIDDDGNGYVDDCKGWDFCHEVVGSNEIGCMGGDNDPNDDNGHGTHVSGIAAAHTDNGVGIAGVCWGCTIMPIKVCDSTGFHCTSENVALGIEYAINNDADVINLSLGIGVESEVLKEALIKAYNAGIVSVCAAGNEAGAVSYPAAYDQYCIAVAAIKNDGKQTFFSNFGTEVDVAAPGVDIYSTAIKVNECGVCNYIPAICSFHPSLCFMAGATTCEDFCSCNDENQYAFCTGTSMASPFVAGSAGLLLSQNSEYSVDQVMLKIMQTAQDTGTSGQDENFGFGMAKIQPANNDSVDIVIDKESVLCFISLVD